MEAKRFDPYGRIYVAFGFSILGLFFHWTFCTRGQIENKSQTIKLMETMSFTVLER